MGLPFVKDEEEVTIVFYILRSVYNSVDLLIYLCDTKAKAKPYALTSRYINCL